MNALFAIPHNMRFALLVAVLVASLTACGGADARKASHFARGQEYYRSQNYDKANVEFRNALQIDPNDAEARFWAGRTAEALGNLQDAAGMYQAAIDIDPNHTAAIANLARMFVFAGAPQRAMEYITPAIERFTKDADLLTVRGAARLQMGNTDAALDDAQSALAQAPDDENAIALLASIYRQSNKLDEAVKLVSRAVERNPKTIDLRQILASLYFDSDKIDESSEQVRRLIALQPRVLQHRYQLALLESHANRKDDAQRVLEEAVTQFADLPDPKITLINFIADNFGRDRALERLDQFVAAEPGNFELRLGKGAFLQRLGMADAAVEAYRAVVADARTGKAANAARNRLAALEIQRDHLTVAKKLIAEVLEENPRDNDALLMRGNLALDANDTATAVADLRAVLRDQPGAVGVLRSLARAHVRSGEIKLAEDNLRAALDAQPDNPDVAIELAQLLGSTARLPQAITILERVGERFPNNIAVQHALTLGYVNSKNYVAARSSSEKLKTMAPQEASGWYFAGLIAQAQGRYDESVDEFSEALARNPQAADALAALARSEIALGETKRAIERVRKIVDATPGDVVSRNLLGELFLAAKDLPQARTEIEKTIATKSNWWLPYRNLALVELSAGRLTDAVRAYEAGLKAVPDQEMLLGELSALHERSGHADLAIGLYEEAFKRRPQSNVIANNLAMLLVNYRGSNRDSLTRANEIAARFADASEPRYLDTYAWILLKMGDAVAALPLLERAAENAPDSSVVRYHLAVAQLQSGQGNHARENLEKVLKGTPRFAGVADARRLLDELKGRGS